MNADNKIAIVTSRFNQPVTEKLYAGAIERLKEINFPEENLDSFTVPGAVEIPLVAQQLARGKQYDAIICLGAVIRGETSHYDYVCQMVSDGCQTVSLENDLPVIFGVLTTENAEQAFDRLGGKHGHKGKDSVDVAIEMMGLLSKLREPANA